jgi:DNA repair exonuclease SbcCD ATPase subunit
MIHFKKVRWKNLLSSGNKFTTIELDRSSTTLILGDNGAGKSTLLDALCFGLYGKGFRNLKKDLLVNSINNKDLLVEIEFSIGKKEYKVIRGAKPNRFELYINNTLINQDASMRDYQDHLEKNILKMSHRSFTQVAILGSANFTPFMQLKPRDRRKLVEDLLDISIFSTMKLLLRKKVSDHNIEVKETEHEVEILEERINGLNSQLNALQKNRDEQIQKYESSIEETEANINSLLQRVDEKTKNVVEKKSLIEDSTSQKDRLQQANELERKLSDNYKKAIKDVEFYESNEECPTCKQGLDEEHKKQHIQERQSKADEIRSALGEISKQIQGTQNRLEEIREVQDAIEEVQRTIGLLQTEITSNQKYIKKIQSQIEELSKGISGGDEVSDKLTDSEDTLDTLLAKKQSLIDRTHYFEIAQLLLRDEGIKSRIIKQYVPIMNKLINKYLASLEFYVGFELDENFDETIKSRFRDVFKYENFSQGEKMRIDLALLFTWRAVARMKNSVNTNLLILDEVFDSSLDEAGTDDFLRLLNTLSEKTNAFIISHKGDQLYDKFEEIIRFEKHKNFSRIQVS